MDLIEVKNGDICRHPWELSRVDCLIKETIKYHKGKNILDIGCGDSFFDRMLLNSNIDLEKLYGIDIYSKKDIYEDKYTVINDYKKLKGLKFDTILMFDVLEHIEDDADFLKKTVLPMLNKHGRIIMTVPAFQSLFSRHDEVLRHYRRYNIKEIKSVANRVSLTVKNFHYFYFMLVPVRILTKLMNKDNKANNWKYNEKHIVTKLMRMILSLDYAICKKMNKLSLGLSLFIVLEKK